jgi:membrane protein DedA with SNARE-associated domain
MQTFIQHYGYVALFLVAVLSSACIPIPSEVAFGYAGAFCTLAVGGAKHFNLAEVIIVGSVGSVIGSVITYEVGRYAGRPIVDRWGKWILLTHKDLDHAEAWFKRYGAISVFIGRIIPVIRAVISLPAGLAEMKRGPFIALSTLGSVIWVAILAYAGKAAGAHWQRVSHDVHKAQLPIIAVVVVLVVAFFWHRIRTVKRHLAS